MASHRHSEPPSDPALRVKALESLLTEKKLIDPAAIDALIETFETKIGPRNGAKVVARAWVDPAYKQRLLSDATKAIAELGYSGMQGEDMVVVENTPKVHNLLVCTLCSCYPWPVLGLPPVWYKAAPYRARGDRAARGARGVRPQAAGRRRDPHLGFDRGTPLHGATRASRGHRGLERGSARGAGHARCHDRRRQGQAAGALRGRA